MTSRNLQFPGRYSNHPSPESFICLRKAEAKVSWKRLNWKYVFPQSIAFRVFAADVHLYLSIFHCLFLFVLLAWWDLSKIDCGFSVISSDISMVGASGGDVGKPTSGGNGSTSSDVQMTLPQVKNCSKDAKVFRIIYKCNTPWRNL